MENRSVLTAPDILNPSRQPRWSEINESLAQMFPFNAIASIRFWISLPTLSGPYFSGTGWFVAPNVVVTAAHVTDIRPLAEKIRIDSWHIEVVPGLAEGIRPSGSFFASDLTPHPSWDRIAASPFDIAGIRLDRQVLPPNFCLRAVAFADAEFRSIAARVVGYPGLLGGDTMATHEGPVGAIEGHQVFYAVDTEDGQSGGPVFASMNQESAPVVIAIHAGGRGHGSTPQAQNLNVGLRTYPALIEWIRQLIAR